MVFFPGCSLSQVWKPPGHMRKGGFYRLHRVVHCFVLLLFFLTTNLDIGSVIIPSICHLMPFQKGFTCFCADSYKNAFGTGGVETMA